MSSLYPLIYLVVQQIPVGQVASYGDIATIVGRGCDARTVGYALGSLPADQQQQVPWQRVVSQSGAISTRGLVQRDLLLSEGVTFDAHDCVVMETNRWAGPDAAWAAAHQCHQLPPRPLPPQQLQLF